MASTEQKLYISVESDDQVDFVLSILRLSLARVFKNTEEGDWPVAIQKGKKGEVFTTVEVDEKDLPLLRFVVDRFADVDFVASQNTPKAALEYLQAKLIYDGKTVVSLLEIEQGISNFIAKFKEEKKLCRKFFFALKRHIKRENKEDQVNSEFLETFFMNDNQKQLVLNNIRNINGIGIPSLKVLQRLIYFVITDGELLENEHWYTK